MIWTLGDFQQRLSLDRRAGRPISPTCSPRWASVTCGSTNSICRWQAIVCALPAGASTGLFHDETAVAMKLPSLRDVGTEGALAADRHPRLHLDHAADLSHVSCFAISPKEDAFAGKLWPAHPTLHNFHIVFYQQHYFLRDFWIQFWNSTVIAGFRSALLTLFIADRGSVSRSRGCAFPRWPLGHESGAVHLLHPGRVPRRSDVPDHGPPMASSTITGP